LQALGYHDFVDRKYLLNKGPRRAKIVRIVAKSFDLGCVVLTGLISYPWGVFLGLGYLAVCDSLFDGQSFGKRFFGFRVVSLKDGLPCTTKQSFIRNLPFTVPLFFLLIPFWGWLVFFLLVIPLGFLELYLLLRLDSTHRLGDVMADTTVIGHDPLSAKYESQTTWFKDQKSLHWQ
jgi:uncharacterized RDD family membrane protein YckC